MGVGGTLDRRDGFARRGGISVQRVRARLEGERGGWRKGWPRYHPSMEFTQICLKVKTVCALRASARRLVCVCVCVCVVGGDTTRVSALTPLTSL